MEGDMCPWRGKVIFFDWNCYGVPYEKGWKITEKTTCLYEGEYAPMKGKGQGFWLKLMGGFPMKKGWKSRKNHLSLWKGKSAYEGESKSFH